MLRWVAHPLIIDEVSYISDRSLSVRILWSMRRLQITMSKLRSHAPLATTLGKRLIS